VDCESVVRQQPAGTGWLKKGEDGLPTKRISEAEVDEFVQQILEERGHTNKTIFSYLDEKLVLRNSMTKKCRHIKAYSVSEWPRKSQQIYDFVTSDYKLQNIIFLCQCFASLALARFMSER